MEFRKRYDADPSDQNGYPDSDPARAWGVSEWARRAGQGAYFDWVVANALLDDVDDDPTHADSIKKIDRTTVPELREISAAYGEIQATLDEADKGLNPLGLAANVVPFGLNPDDIDEGKTHVEQIYVRAIAALRNAVDVFSYANENTQRLRKVQDRAEEFADLNDEREQDFKNRLIEVFGRPYREDIEGNQCTGCPAPAYRAGYDGPDLYHYAAVDPVEYLGIDSNVNTATFVVTLQERHIDPETGAVSFTENDIVYNVSTDGFDVVKDEGWTSRLEPGQIQFARAEILQALGRYIQAIDAYEAHLDQIENLTDTIQSQVGISSEYLMIMDEEIEAQQLLKDNIIQARDDQLDHRREANATRAIARITADALPMMEIFGVASGGDFMGPLRSLIKTAARITSEFMESSAEDDTLKELRHNLDLQLAQNSMQRRLIPLQQAQGIQHYLDQLQDLVRATPGLRLEMYMLREAANQAAARYQAVLGRGLRLHEQRTVFRQRTADQVSQYRYLDMAFRVFRNEALQKYRAQFDLAAQYAYLAAKAYDYETNLLGTHSGNGRQFFEDIVEERVLGVLGGEGPMPGKGLAGKLADMSANWTWFESLLGFGSDEFTNTFSLRWELFRKPNLLSFDGEWRKILSNCVVGDINDPSRLPEYRQYCLPIGYVGVNPAIVIPFETFIQSGMNFFGKPSIGDELVPSDRYAIKLHFYAVRFSNYPGYPLNNNPFVYLVPVGGDVMRVPRCPDPSHPEVSIPIRTWHLLDQTLPPPMQIVFGDGPGQLYNPYWMPWDNIWGGSQAMIQRRLIPTVVSKPLSECPDPTYCENTFSQKLTGRSIWNTRWLLIIPESELAGDPEVDGIDIFINGTSDYDTGVRDIKLVFRSYGYAACVPGTRAKSARDKGPGAGDKQRPVRAVVK